MSSTAGNVPSAETTSQVPFVEIATDVGAVAGLTAGDVLGGVVTEGTVGVTDGRGVVTGALGVTDGVTTAGVVSVGAGVVTGVRPPFGAVRRGGTCGCGCTLGVSGAVAVGIGGAAI